MRGPGERVPGVVAGGRIAGGPPHLWDGVVRLTHWSLAAAIVANALLTREGGAAHVAVGWAAAALLLLRLGWGLVGPSEARFSAFPPSPRGALRHLATLIAGRPREFRSHNPAGAMMVYALWALLAVVIGTGLGMTRQSPMAIAAQEAAVAEGDWAAMVAEGGGEKGAAGMTEVLEDVHGTAANLILVLAALHVAGVAAESLALRRNLVRAMLFGSRMTRAMTRNALRARRGRPAALTLLLAVQTLAAFFFIGDALTDLRADPATPHALFEALVTLALVLGIIFGARELAAAIARMRTQDAALAAASGALAEVIAGQFDAWGLTPAERDVGFFALKGMDVAEIAALRGAAPGTVRAQLTRIYAKAGVSGRAQFAALFVEDLLGEGVPAAAPQPAARRA